MPSLDTSLQDVSTTGLYEAFSSTLQMLTAAKKAALAADASHKSLASAKASVTQDMTLRTASVNKGEDVVRKALGAMKKLNLSMKGPEVRRFLSHSEKATGEAIARLTEILKKSENATNAAVKALTDGAQASARLAVKGAQANSLAHTAERVMFGSDPGSRGFQASEEAKTTATKASDVASYAKMASNEIRQALKLMEHQKITGGPPLVTRALKDLTDANKNLDIAKVYADATDGTRAEWSRSYFEIFSALKFLQGHLRMIDAFTADDVATLKILEHAQTALAKVREAVKAADADGSKVENILDPTGAMKVEMDIIQKARAAAKAVKLAKQLVLQPEVLVSVHVCTRRRILEQFLF